MKQKEQRELTFKSAPTMQKREGKLYIRGLIPYNSPSEWMGFVEVLAPSAFNKTLADGSDVKALRNHDSSQILGRTKNGTLKLETSTEGLICEVQINEKVTYALDLYAAVERGDVDTMSFLFFAIQEEVARKEDGTDLRTILEARLVEVSFGVTFPAYAQTSSVAMQRSLEDLLSSESLDDEGVKQLSETKAKIDERLARQSPPPPEPLPSTQADTDAMQKQAAAALAMINI